MPTSDSAPRERELRLAGLDDIRGVASLWVACAHIYTQGVAFPVLAAHLPWMVTTFFSHGGHLGVCIFFVLSGFVIAHSTWHADLSGRYLLEFSVRRSLRLDPPYWLVLVGIVALNALSNLIFTERTAPVPDVRWFLHNAFYLQAFGTRAGILGVAWTLCLEIQFYLVFVVLSYVAARFVGRRQVRSAALPFFVPLLAWSVLMLFDLARGSAMVQYWYAFFGGVLACWSARGSIRPAIPLTVAGIALAAALVTRHDEPAMAAITIASFAILARPSGWFARSHSHMLLRLGAWSYSLYLVHTVIGAAVQDVGHRVTGDAFIPAALWALTALALSMAVAAAMRHFVELPSLRLSRALAGWANARAASPEHAFFQPARQSSDATRETSR